VTHHPRKLAEHSLGLRGRRFDSKGRNRSRQDQGPQDSELPLFHVLYLPGAVLAVVLASGAAFTVKSAVREMVRFECVSVASTSRVYLPGASVASGRNRSRSE